MRVAFDLDNTLIPTTTSFSVGSEVLGFPWNLFFKEPIRKNAPELLRKIGTEHELWIYTSSLRSERAVKTWLFLWGVKVSTVLNLDGHNRAVSGDPVYSGFSKCPGFFGIDLLIDDSPGVAMECEQQGCKSLIIDPNDNNWSNKILEYLQIETDSGLLV